MNASIDSLWQVQRTPCGGVLVQVNGTPCTLRPAGTLWLADHGTLVASDLHLEKGSAYASRGQLLPPFDSAATLKRLASEIKALEPERVILLGDSFHDRAALDRLTAADRAEIDRLAAGRDWIWLEGNHDLETLTGALDPLPGRVVSTLSIGTLHLTHEPEPGARPGEVAGHLHPAVRVSGHGHRVRRPCFVTDGQRLILPAFGALTGGLDVTDPALADLFATPCLHAALGKGRLHALVRTTASGVGSRRHSGTRPTT